MFMEQRCDLREPLRMPLTLADGTEATTRDVSPSGMYFEVPGDCPLQGTVPLEMLLVEARMKFTAQGEVVRIEHMACHTGVAVKLVAPRLEPVP